jgi:hypothetical protein
MERKTISLVATGEDSGAFQAWGVKAAGANNTFPWSTGKDLLRQLETATKQGRDCIRRLYIFSHAWLYHTYGNRGGVYAGGPDNSGFYLYKQSGDHPDARYLEDLKTRMTQGKNRFCTPCEIILTGCRVAASDFPARLASITRCSVTAAKGSSYPKPGNPPGDVTGEWISNAGGREELDDAKAKGLYLGWMKYVYDKGTGKVISQKIGYKTTLGFILDIW